MSSGDIFNGVRRVARFVGDAKHQAVDDHESRLVSDVEYQGLTNMVDALIEVGINDKKIIEIAQEYYRHYSFEELEHLIRGERTIGVPLRQLVEYLQTERNYLYEEAWDYTDENHVSSMLARNRELYKKSPKDLYELIEKSE